jgi:hypothetical protein
MERSDPVLWAVPPCSPTVYNLIAKVETFDCIICEFEYSNLADLEHFEVDVEVSLTQFSYVVKCQLFISEPNVLLFTNPNGTYFQTHASSLG